MAFVLEGAHPLQRDPAADVDVGRRDVDPQLHAQRPAERELALQPAFGQDVDRVPCELRDSHGPSLDSLGLASSQTS